MQPYKDPFEDLEDIEKISDAAGTPAPSMEPADPYANIELPEWMQSENPAVTSARSQRDETLSDLAMIQGITQMGAALAGQKADTSGIEAQRRQAENLAKEALYDSSNKQKLTAQYIKDQLAKQEAAKKAATDEKRYAQTLGIQKERLDASKLSNEARLAETKAQNEFNRLQAELTRKFREDQAREKKEKVAQKESLSQKAKVDTANVMIDEIGQAKKIISDAEGSVLPATGMAAPYVAMFSGTNAANLKNRLKTIRGNLAFDKLQEMRSASPTGGALGNVSEKELALLESSFQNVEQAQTSEELMKSLNDLEKRYQAVIHGSAEQPNTAPANTSPVTQAGKVRVIHPKTGKPGFIPADKLEKALKAGFTRG